MIRLESVSMIFGRTVALDRLDLTVGPGITGLFGPNASGKSTLLRIVAGLLRPTVGNVSIEGRRISLAREEFRRVVGYAGHEAGLYGRLTIAENLSLFADLYGARAGRAAELVEGLGLGARADTRVADLSAGLKRRAAVARALLHDPQLLLLDEPYANLDDEAAELVSETVKAWRGHGRIGVIATHGAKRLKSFCDASLVLRQGRPASYRTRPIEVA